MSSVQVGEDDKGEPSQEHIGEFWETVAQHTRSRIAVRDIPSACLAEGLRELKSSHHLCSAALVAGETPTLFFSLPSAVRAIDLSPDDLLFLPWGWDTHFGGSLTISAVLTSGPRPAFFGCLYVAGTDESALALLMQGRFVCVLTKNHVPAAAFAVDMCATSSTEALYREQWTRATTHLGLRSDPEALFWATVKCARPVAESLGLSARDLLSLGWMERYAGAVRELDAEVRAFKQLFSWPKTAALPERWAAWCQLFRDDAITVDALIEHVASEYSKSASMLWEVLSPDYHDAMHEVMGDHSPLCNAPIAAVDAFLLTSKMTECGLRVPVLRGRDVGFHTIAPDRFEDVAPDKFWPRVVHLPAEWNSLVESGDVPADLTKGSALLALMPKAEDGEVSGDAAEALLEEALAERKWTIPPDAVLDLKIGPFSRVELCEREGAVDFVLRTDSGEFSAGGILLAKDERRLWWEALAVFEEDEERRRIASGLYLIMAATIRDFLVVEQREAVFAQRTPSGRKSGRTANIEGPRIIYIPRIVYAGGADVERCRTDLAQGELARRAHGVRPHLRRCEAASPAQLFLARRYAIDVPQGYTFVRPHERGKQSRDVIYRSRSALQCLYRVKPPGSLSQVAWFDFERDVYRVMERLGFHVQHVAASRRGDRGVDVYATKGADLDQASWVIQCKAYSTGRNVGPHIVRELMCEFRLMVTTRFAAS